MKLFVVALLLFLVAFAGLAIGLILRRKGIRSGCGHTTTTDCRCESELDANMKGKLNLNCENKEQH